MGKKKSFSRRDVLKAAAASGLLMGDDPVQIILKALYNKEFGVAHAREQKGYLGS